MDAVYYVSSTLMTLILFGLLVVTIVFLVKPHLLNNRKAIKKPFSRGKIVLVGIVAIVITMVGFGPILAAAEPADIKAARMAREAEEAQKSTGTQLEPVKSETTIKKETAIEVVPFSATEEESNSLVKGEKKITTQGTNGEKTIYYQVTYVGGKETTRVITKEVITKDPVTQVTILGTYVAPVVQPKKGTSSESGTSCNPNYSGCVPNVSYDLDCPDIGQKVRVLGYDQYRLDADDDGWGCDSY